MNEDGKVIKIGALEKYRCCSHIAATRHMLARLNQAKMGMVTSPGTKAECIALSEAQTPTRTHGRPKENNNG